MQLQSLSSLSKKSSKDSSIDIWRWSCAGSLLLQQPITVTPRMNRPPPSLTPHYGRGRGGFGPAAFPGAGRGVPFSPRGGGTFRSRGRAPQPLTNHKYVRPELLAELEKQKSGAGLAVAASADAPTG